MKTKYDRMTRYEKKEILEKYKKDNYDKYKKIKRMYIFCYIGIILSSISFIYDLLLSKGKYNFIYDIFLLLFCIMFLRWVSKNKSIALTDYILKK